MAAITIPANIHAIAIHATDVNHAETTASGSSGITSGY